MKKWNGEIPERRYAMFVDAFYRNYMVVVTGNDMITAPKWGGFVQWIGGVRPAEKRNIKIKQNRAGI